MFNLVDPVRDQNPDSDDPLGRCCPETGNRMKKVTCGHPIPAPVSGKKIRKTTPFRFPDGHKVASEGGELINQLRRKAETRAASCREFESCSEAVPTRDIYICAPDDDSEHSITDLEIHFSRCRRCRVVLAEPTSPKAVGLSLPSIRTPLFICSSSHRLVRAH